MAYADQLSAVRVHAVAAGGAVTPAILDVAVGPALPLTSRCVRIFYGGEVEPERMAAGLTLTSQMVAERIIVALYLSVSNVSLQEIEAIETELYAFKHELRTRILADSDLGGQSTDLVMSLVEPDYVVVGNTRYRTLETEIRTEFTEYTISA